MRKWSELFPDGRWLFYEGDDPEGFANEMVTKFQFDPRKGNDSWSAARGYGFMLPGRCMDEVYGRDKYPLGS